MKEELNKLAKLETNKQKDINIANDSDYQIVESDSLSLGSLKKTVKPNDIFVALDRKIVGQAKAKKALALAASNHKNRSKNPLIPKSNVLIAGPSGTGKTMMCEVLASCLDVGFVNFDATDLTTEGYTGKSKSDIFYQLLINCDMNIKKAQRAIVFIDEIDKKAVLSRNSGEIGTSAVQSALLKMLEGSVIDVKIEGKNYQLKTHDMMFVCAGAFGGISNQEEVSQSVGLNSTVRSSNKKSLTDKIINFGLSNELVGRFNTITSTDHLEYNDLLNIVSSPMNSFVLGQIEMFKTYGIELSLKSDFFEEVAKKASKLNTGARGLNPIISEISSNILFDIDSKATKITLRKGGYQINSKRKITPFKED